VEQDCDLGEVLKGLPDHVAVQGNLDPDFLLGDRDALAKDARRIAQSVPMGRHIFNLGHGIQQKTDPGAVQVMIDAVRQFDLGMA
jgi:uroporphyrinogen decarboxylase